MKCTSRTRIWDQSLRLGWQTHHKLLLSPWGQNKNVIIQHCSAETSTKHTENMIGIEQDLRVSFVSLSNRSTHKPFHRSRHSLKTAFLGKDTQYIRLTCKYEKLINTTNSDSPNLFLIISHPAQWREKAPITELRWRNAYRNILLEWSTPFENRIKSITLS